LRGPYAIAELLVLQSHLGQKTESTYTLQYGCAAHIQGCISQWMSW